MTNVELAQIIARAIVADIRDERLQRSSASQPVKQPSEVAKVVSR